MSTVTYSYVDIFGRRRSIELEPMNEWGGQATHESGRVYKRIDNRLWLIGSYNHATIDNTKTLCRWERRFGMQEFSPPNLLGSIVAVHT